MDRWGHGERDTARPPAALPSLPVVAKRPAWPGFHPHPGPLRPLSHLKKAGPWVSSEASRL